jgi:NADH dehydrogenase/NADH:ubiquinone oxidoreductase subunit G
LSTLEDDKYVQQIEQNIGHKLKKEKIANEHKHIKRIKNQAKNLKGEKKRENKTNKYHNKVNKEKETNIQEKDKDTLGMGDHIPAFLQK